jgi:predicted anti-sigma-YlaC factor YlaD
MNLQLSFSWAGVLLCLLALPQPGCSIRRMAVNQLGDALAGGGTTFASDDDPELVKAAVPFSLKLMESLLDESPRHQGLLFATASGFTQYAYAFVQQDADELEEQDVAAAQAARQRAARLYLRARNYALRGLETAHPGFTNALRADAVAAVKTLVKKDVPQSYWAAVSWAAAIAASKDNPDLIADLPKVEALIDRALALDETFDHGAIHAFLISYELSRQGATGDAEARARKHFGRAMQLGDGQIAGPLVSLAEAVSVKNQNVAEFQALLEQALAINPDARPEWRLANLIMQRRARWLLSRTENLFLLSPKP